jgi:hypothetical protein
VGIFKKTKVVKRGLTSYFYFFIISVIYIYIYINIHTLGLKEVDIVKGCSSNKEDDFELASVTLVLKIRVVFSNFWRMIMKFNRLLSLFI